MLAKWAGPGGLGWETRWPLLIAAVRNTRRVEKFGVHNLPAVLGVCVCVFVCYLCVCALGPSLRLWLRLLTARLPPPTHPTARLAVERAPPCWE